MPSPRVAPYGTWRSPLPAAAVAAGGLRLSATTVDGPDIYWLEGRPHEGGRYALVRRDAAGGVEDVTPLDANVRTRVHEYGGGAYVVSDGTVYYTNFADQRIYRIARAADGSPGDPKVSGLGRDALTPAGAWYYADLIVDRRRGAVICVREDHTGPGEPVNALVRLPLDGSSGAGDVIESGYDFYSTPRLSPDGSQLAWLSWRHPQMPWDGTELWLGSVDATGAVRDTVRLAGGENESIYQPGWSPAGVLYFVSDRDGWWKIYRLDPSSRSIEAVLAQPPRDAEFGRPQWVFGTATWAFAGPSRLLVSYTLGGRWHLATVDVGTGVVADIAPDLQPNEWLAATSTHAVVVAATSTRPDAVIRIDLRTGAREELRQAAPAMLDPGDISEAVAFEFATDDQATAHAFYYAPRNKDFTAPDGERPPLVVISHGGPTSAASPTFHLEVQYWTTRGFAVADVNYGGSSGYGRAYRQRLDGRWGIVDVADVINTGRFLASQGKADDQRLVIRGGSAGGYTTLAALTFRPEVFKAGASYYGISDLEVLEVDTHKFESRYSHRLIGPYPAARETYRARSPIHYVDRLSCPLILFQGLEDKVVPPNQSQMMADAVRAKGLPVAYLGFAGEQHGFRQAATIIRCLEAELFFYASVFAFTPADAIEPVPIDNL